MSLTVQEFLRRKGAIGMLAMLHERPMTYSELAPQIGITSSTITERRDDAAELGLLEVNLGEGEVGTKKVYELTDMGEFLAEKMAREGITSNYRKMRALQELLDEQTDDLVGWVENNPSQLLQFPEAEEGTITKRETPLGEGEDSEMSSSEPGNSEGSVPNDVDIASDQDNPSLDHPDPAGEPQPSDSEEMNDGDSSTPYGRPSEIAGDDRDDVNPGRLNQRTFSEMEADEDASDGERSEE